MSSAVENSVSVSITNTGTPRAPAMKPRDAAIATRAQQTIVAATATTTATTTASNHTVIGDRYKNTAAVLMANLSIQQKFTGAYGKPEVLQQPVYSDIATEFAAAAKQRTFGRQQPPSKVDLFESSDDLNFNTHNKLISSSNRPFMYDFHHRNDHKRPKTDEGKNGD